MIAICVQRCRDGKASRRYGNKDIGKQFDIDPMDPIAQYFQFPEGTEKYDKKAGTVIQGATQDVVLPSDTVKKIEKKKKKGE